MSQRTTIVYAVAILLSCSLASTGASQETAFADYAAAHRAGGDLYNMRKFEECRAPLEAAAKLAETELQRCEVHDLLVVANAEARDFERMYASAEYVFEHAPFPSFASNSCKVFLGHVQLKGQREIALKRYEERLAKNAKDRVALYILANFHKELTRDFPKQVDYLTRLLALDKAEGKELDFETAQDLAEAYQRAGKYVESAELFEKIASLNKDEEAWNHKEAAGSWLKAKQAGKALAAARKADSLGPDKRAKRSLDRWHSELGEIYLATNERALAVKHYEQAVESARTDSAKKKYAAQLEAAKKP